MELWCTIYKHPKTELMYLYVKKDSKLDDLPKELLAQFGNPVYVMDLCLTPALKLAREDVEKVMKNITDLGFHLQLPPVIGADVDNLL